MPPADDSLPPLIPILRADDALADPVALATWYEALSNTLGVNLPHDLLALWLYPTDGAPVLLGPAALAQDDLTVPRPAPFVLPEQVAVLEEIIRDAGYGSAAALPVRSGKTDVGLLLVADLQPERYGEEERATLEAVAHQLAPTFARMARQWSARDAGTRSLAREAELVAGIGEAFATTRIPRDFATALSRALEPVLPHDQIEILIPGVPADQYFRLGEHVGGPLWADPSLVISREHLDIGGLFADRRTILIADAWREADWPRGLLTAAQPAGADLRSIAGMQVTSGNRGVAYFLVGSIAPDLYRPADLPTLLRVGALIGPKLEEFVVGWQLQTARAQLDAIGSAPMRLPRIAELLATEPDFARAARLAADEIAGLVPCDEIRFALRLNDGSRVVLIQPGDSRPLPDLPSEPVGGRPLARVLAGEVPSLISEEEGTSELIVPLRVAGRIHGALLLRTRATAAFFPPDLPIAQQAADLLAAHLELLRRAALLPPPFIPGWKRSSG